MNLPDFIKNLKFEIENKECLQCGAIYKKIYTLVKKFEVRMPIEMSEMPEYDGFILKRGKRRAGEVIAKSIVTSALDIFYSNLNENIFGKPGDYRLFLTAEARPGKPILIMHPKDFSEGYPLDFEYKSKK